MDLDAPAQPCYTRGCYGITFFLWACVFAYFTFSKVDQGYCWAKEDSNIPISSTVPVEGYTLVNLQFTNWFMWNFIVYSFYSYSSLLFSCFPLIDQLFQLNYNTFVLVRIGFMIWGLVIRLSHNGKVCSGDFHVDSGEHPEPYQWVSGFFILFSIVFWVVSIPITTVIQVLYTKKIKDSEDDFDD